MASYGAPGMLYYIYWELMKWNLYSIKICITHSFSMIFLKYNIRTFAIQATNKVVSVCWL